MKSKVVHHSQLTVTVCALLISCWFSVDNAHALCVSDGDPYLAEPTKKYDTGDPYVEYDEWELQGDGVYPCQEGQTTYRRLVQLKQDQETWMMKWQARKQDNEACPLVQCPPLQLGYVKLEPPVITFVLVYSYYQPRCDDPIIYA